MYSKQTRCHTHTAHGKHGSVGVEKHSSKVGLWHTAASGAPVVFTVTQYSKNVCHKIRRVSIIHPSWQPAPPCTSFQSTEKPLGHMQKKMNGAIQSFSVHNQSSSIQQKCIVTHWQTLSGVLHTSWNSQFELMTSTYLSRHEQTNLISNC